MGLWQEWRIRQSARLRTEGRGWLLWALRITVAAVASYVVGAALLPSPQPLLAPLTAMLVVQVTPVSLLASGFDRVVAVVVGVLLAVAFGAVVPLTWWSLGVLVFVSILVGQILRLRENLMEVAISGMLVLGVGALGVQSVAWQRIAETLVGAGVGVALNLLVPPRVPTADAGRAIEGLADELSDLLTRAAEALEERARDHRAIGPAAQDWLGRARQITHDDVPRVGASLLRAEQGRRLNVRAVGTADLGPGLRQGLESLEHTAVAIRSLFRALADATTNEAWVDDEQAERVMLGLSVTLRELGAAIDAFGALVRLEAAPQSELNAADLRPLREAVDGLLDARMRLEEAPDAVLTGPVGELHSTVLSIVGRVQWELDLDQRIRRQIRSRPPGATRPARLRSKVARRRPPAEVSPPSAETSPPSAETSPPSAEASLPSAEASPPSAEASVPSADASAETQTLRLPAVHDDDPDRA